MLYPHCNVEEVHEALRVPRLTLRKGHELYEIMVLLITNRGSSHTPAAPS